MIKVLSFKDFFFILLAGMSGRANHRAPLARSEQILSRQVQTAFATAPITIVSSLVVMVFLVLSLSGKADPFVLAAWAAATIGVLAILLVLKLLYAAEGVREAARSRFWARSLEVVAGVRALIWGSGAIAFFPGADPERQLIVGLAVVGIMCGGAFGLGSVPATAILFTLLTGCASIIALSMAGTPVTAALAVMNIGFMAYLSVAILNQGRVFVAHALSEIINDEQKQTIGLLLKEFQDNSSDWLWHTNSDGYFIGVNARFVSASGCTAMELEQRRFADLITLDAGGTNSEAIELFTRRRSMTGVEVRLDVGGERRFWTLTAGPVYDEQQVFVGFRGVAGDVTDQRAAADRLENLAHFDQLTGLPNRSSFLEALNAAISDGGPDSVGLVLFDLTGFKQVNDTLGHGVGDELLKRLGHRMAGLGAEDRVFARLGGDEFALVIRSSPTPSELASSAREALALFALPFAIGPHNVVVDASAGIALGGRDGTDAVALMRAADLALYAAKSSGRGQWLEFDKAMAAAYLRRQNLERGLRDAIEQNELSLRFQPIISTRSGQVSAFEALLRWESAEFGSVGPSEFIPIAEESGMIVPIGNWVLREATRTCASCEYGTQICVNVSPVQLRNKKLVAEVRSSLQDGGLPPERLVLEITEGVLLERSAQTDKTLRDLLALGVQIALDDFGTGYSSLSYLRSFPFSKIKIDKSFIDDIAAEGPNALIVKSIVDLATALGFEVVAEGVETHAQLAEIVRLGCDQVQGYLFSRPLQRSEVSEFMRTLLTQERSRIAVGQSWESGVGSVASQGEVRRLIDS